MGNAQVKAQSEQIVTYTLIKNPDQSTDKKYILSGNFSLDLNATTAEGENVYVFDLWNLSNQDKQYHVVGLWNATSTVIPNEFWLTSPPVYLDTIYAKIGDIFTTRTDTLTMMEAI